MTRGNSLTIGTLTPVPSFVASEAMSTAAAQVVALTKGPYRLSEDSEPKHVRLVPAAGAFPAIPEVHIVAFPSDAGGLQALIAAFNRGEIDVSVDVPAEAVGGLEHASVRHGPGDNTGLLFLNTESEGLASAGARRSLAAALNHADIAAAAHADDPEFAALGLLPPSLQSSRPSEAWWPFDPVQAKDAFAPERLAGRDLVMLTPWAPRPYLADPWRAGEAVAEALALVGVAVTIKPAATPAEALSRACSGDYDLFLVGWSADDLDPISFYEALLHSESIPGGPRDLAASFNLGRIREPEIDRVLAEVRARGGGSASAEIEALAARYASVVPLCHGPSVMVTGPRVRALRLLAGGIVDVSDAEVLS
ncbi:MAG: ABC transporter substrate-binding protein [Nannocystales bacterium]